MQRIAGGIKKYKDEDLLRSLFIVRPGRCVDARRR
jgi:hypothetical protein